MKICSKCKEEKEESYYTKDKRRKDGLNPYCRLCRKRQKNNYYLVNKKTVLEKQKIYKQKNKTSIREKAKQYYKNNPEIIKQTKKKEYIKNIDKYKDYAKRRQRLKKEELAAYQKTYRLEHKKDRNNRHKQRVAIDSLYKLAVNLRSRFGAAIRCGYKTGSAIKDLGCSIEQLKDWIEKQFETGMSWDNYGNKEGQWSIDHEYPLSLVDLSKRELVLPLVHYTNLQPMWHTKNMSKNNNLI